MTNEEIQKIVLECLEAVAPEVDTASLDPTEALRDALDLDSMDFLSFVTKIHERLGIDIPEADYPKLESIAAFVAYVAGKARGPT